jgi:hypothetical protein
MGRRVTVTARPYGDDGTLVANGPRYAGNAVPADVECGCIWTSIDAALEAAGFRGWMTASDLMDVAYQDRPLWKRPGVR